MHSVNKKQTKVLILLGVSLLLAFPIAIGNNLLFNSDLFNTTDSANSVAAKEIIQTVTKEEAKEISKEEAESEISEAEEESAEPQENESSESNSQDQKASVSDTNNTNNSNPSSTNSNSSPNPNNSQNSGSANTSNSSNSNQNNSSNNTNNNATPQPTGHWETQQKLVRDAYTETVTTHLVRCMCNQIFSGATLSDAEAAWQAHRPVPCNGQHYRYFDMGEQVSTIEHPAEYETVQVWVED